MKHENENISLDFDYPDVLASAEKPLTIGDILDLEEGKGHGLSERDKQELSILHTSKGLQQLTKPP